MSGFFSRLFSLSPTFEQGLVMELMKQNQALLDRLLEREGIEPIEKKEERAQASSSPSDDVFDEDAMREAEERAEVEEYAANAAANPELFEQALYNAIPGNHPQAERWKQVVQRAEQMKVLVS